VLKKQKQDYEKCLESVTRLTSQLDSAMAVRVVKYMATYSLTVPSFFC